MEPKKEKLIIEGNALYEIDLECLRRKEKLKKEAVKNQIPHKVRQKG